MASNLRLHYIKWGKGDIPVVLVHGYGLSSAVWEKALPLFPSAYRLWAMDLRGCGLSDKPAGGYTCPELADDIGVFLDAMNVPQAVVIGHSFGGLVAQHFAVRHPDRIRALVLCNILAGVVPPKGLSPAVKQRIDGYGTVEANRRIFSASIPRYFDADHVTPDDIERFIGIALQADNTALRETLKANYTTPSLPVSLYAAVRSPVLIFVSTHDPFGSFDHAAALSDAFPESRIEVMTGCGHSPMWEKPREFVGRITAYLSVLQSGA